MPRVYLKMGQSPPQTQPQMKGAPEAGPQALGGTGSHAEHTQLPPRRAHTPPRTPSFGFHGARQEKPRDNVPPSCPCLGSQLRKPPQIQPDTWTK